MDKTFETHYVPTIVIGGGQAGLVTGYHLKKRGLPFLILDAQERVGDSWRRRWDSLRLFTPARYLNFPGMRYRGPKASWPTKDQIADYLEAYAKKFQLPVRNGVKVDELSKDGNRFIVKSGNTQFEADNVIVAMANYQVPRVPGFANELDRSIVQIHSHDYKNPSQLQPGGVLVVGAGNSGADIAMDVVGSHPTWMAGKESGHIPFRIESFVARYLLVRLVRFVGHHVLTLGTPIGRKVRPKLLRQASPLVRVKPQDLIDAGVKRVPRVTGVRNGLPSLADGKVVDVRNVIWCTGYRPGFSWIQIPGSFDEDGRVKQERGVVNAAPGLYFVGLHFQYAMSSATVIGVSRDAERVVKGVAERMKNRGSEAQRFIQAVQAA
jgi:putative flavoprotein involved in K+ transport